MPVYEVTVKGANDKKPRLIKAKNVYRARAHASEDLLITRPTSERVHVLTHRGVKLEFAKGESQVDVEEGSEE